MIALPLGEESLEERLARRLSLRTALDFGEQLLRAVAFAHEQHVIHCDVKPDNLLLFPDGRLRLTDFGISKVAHRTISASGAGTVGYMAPEQAMGRPSRRSRCVRHRPRAVADVFRPVAGVAVRVAAGRLRRSCKAMLHPDMIALLERSLELKPSRRFEDGGQMLAAYLAGQAQGAAASARSAAARKSQDHRRSGIGKKSASSSSSGNSAGSWRRTSNAAAATARCPSPCMACPWCGTGRKVLRDETSFPCLLPALPPRHEARLALSAPGATARDSTTSSERAVQRPPLRRPLPQPEVRSRAT